MTKNDDFFRELISKGAGEDDDGGGGAEEFSQSIQVPSSTHPGTTYPVRAIPHSDKSRFTKAITNVGHGRAMSGVA